MSLPDWRHVTRQVLLATVLAVTYWVSMNWLSPGGVAPVWPASGIALAALLVGGLRYAVAVFVGACIGTILVGNTSPGSILSAAGNTMAAVSGCLILRRWMTGKPRLDTLTAYAGLSFSAVADAGVSALVGMLSLVLFSAVPLSQLPGFAMTWWQGDLLGVLLVTPLVLFVQEKWPAYREMFPRAALLLLAVAFLAGDIIYVGRLAAIPDVYTREYWSFLLVVISALLMGRTVTAILIVMTALQLLVGLGLGASRFGTGLEENPLTVSWVFLVVLAITGTAASLVVHERRLAADALKQAGERRQRTLAAMAEGLILQDSAGEILELNPAAERILGIQAGRLDGSLSLDARWRGIREDGRAFPPERHPARVALATGQSVREEVIGIHREDGRLTWLSVNAEPLSDASGRRDGVVSTFADITPLRNTIDDLVAKTAQLSQQEHFLSVLAENVPAMMSYWTRNLHCLFANARYREWFGLTHEALDRIGLRALLGDRILRARQSHIDAVLRGEAQSFEGDLLNDRGQRMDVVVQYFPDRDASGVRGFIVLIHDVTSLKRAMADRMRLASIVESAADAIFSTSLDGRVLTWNKGAEQMLCCPADEAIDRPVGTVLVFTDSGPLATILETVARGESVHMRRQVWPRGEDAVLHAGFSVSPIRDEQGEVRAVSWIVRNISEQVWAEQALTALNRDLDDRVEARTRELRDAKQLAEAAVLARGRFIANVSHEIRTPLNAVIGMSHLALAGERDPRQRDYLAKIRTSGEHLLTLIDSILDLSRVESGVLALEEIPFRLEGLLRTVSTIVAPSLDLAGRRLVVDLADDVPLVLRGDPLRLRQMLLNYLNNAVKFSSHGDVTLRVRVGAIEAEAVLLQFSVEDFGIGLPAGVAANLFQPFLQADASTSRRYGGTGLGLAITAQIARLMGGSVGVDSEEGVGSCFWFTARLRLAREDIPADDDNATPAMPVETRLRHLRILLVEDSPLNQQVFREMLAWAGAQVTLAESGRQAIDLCRAGGVFDCILMDIQMPGMDGIETLHMLRTQQLAVGVPVIALTANASLEDRTRYREAGMAGYIGKPVRPADLYAGIATVMASPATPADGNRGRGGEGQGSKGVDGDELEAGHAAVIDTAVLHEYIGADAGMRDRFMRIFIDMTAARLEDARVALQAGALEELKAIGHQLKSSARQVGALSFADGCAVLEARGTTMSAEEARQVIASLQALLVRIGEWQAREDESR